MQLHQKLTEIAKHLKQSKRVLFITGAGISAESGLPTYRGVGGLYDQEHTEEGYPIEQCLSASMFRVRPDITWKYMLQIGKAVMQCQPNQAHAIIAQWEKEFAQRGGKVVVLTQNIDGYHRLAGSENVLEIHGTFERLFCTQCLWETSWETLLDTDWGTVPKCPQCGAVIRPRIVMFEEMLPRQVLIQFEEEFDNGNGFDMVFSIGTSSMFPYITRPVYDAINCGKITVEINPASGELSHQVSYYLPIRAAEALHAIERHGK